ncbi:LacI family DNA-binding transcriptional regulator [Stappia stellulata]|uniref:LacI family DNA-binding transcriptional regulator n=1 Tax=Stappia stellulata TaxID=71235 RepID=UPI000491BEF9|nr:LacI family DNA-binding transcriptional regulator [Stappia stellulata]
MAAATSLDVARLAGVSQSAVSRTFTPGASVSAETRAKVLAAASALGYRPNKIARSLITRRSGMIGIVVAYLDNLYYPNVLEKLSRQLQHNGFHALMFFTQQSTDTMDVILGELLEYQVDGLIMVSAGLSSELAARCASNGIPVVLFNRTLDDETLSAVSSDNVDGGEKVARFLLDCGHDRIAYLAGWAGSSTDRDRRLGFTRMLAQNGRTLYREDIGHYDREEARAATRRLFAAPPFPDALFCANDHMAVAALDVLRHELGLSVPQDVAVVGYDDAPMAAWPSYALTTVTQPPDVMVPEAVRLLLQNIEADATRPEQLKFAGELVVRETTRRPSQADGRAGSAMP